MPNSFTDAEKRTLAILADMVIPASAEYHAPSAGDDAIVSEILSDAERHHAHLSIGLATLETLARERHGIDFADLDSAQGADIVDTFRETHPGTANLIANLTTQCYYRDDRVMISLGMEPRPPHPLGFTVEQGDWSLLDQVRERDKFYRKTE